jgi:hypothetical protein
MALAPSRALAHPAPSARRPAHLTLHECIDVGPPLGVGHPAADHGELGGVEPRLLLGVRRAASPRRGVVTAVQCRHVNNQAQLAGSGWACREGLAGSHLGQPPNGQLGGRGRQRPRVSQRASLPRSWGCGLGPAEAELAGAASSSRLDASRIRACCLPPPAGIKGGDPAAGGDPAGSAPGPCRPGVCQRLRRQRQQPQRLLGCTALHRSWLGWAGLGWAGLGWAGLGWAGLGWAGLGWAGVVPSGVVAPPPPAWDDERLLALGSAHRQGQLHCCCCGGPCPGSQLWALGVCSCLQPRPAAIDAYLACHRRGMPSAQARVVEPVVACLCGHLDQPCGGAFPHGGSGGPADLVRWESSGGGGRGNAPQLLQALRTRVGDEGCPVQGRGQGWRSLGCRAGRRAEGGWWGAGCWARAVG